MHSDLKNILTTGAAALVVLFLAWVAIDKSIYSKEEAIETAQNNQEIPETDVAKLLKDSLVISENPKNYSNFALRLADFYLEQYQYDSAGKYQELVAKRFPNEENWVKAGLTYYKAFENASGEEEEQIYVGKSLSCLEKGIDENSKPMLKRKLAELYLAAGKPDNAIELLKQVINTDPTDKETLYIMGMHTFQLNDFKDATHYLGRLVNLDSTHVNGTYYLAISEMKLGNTNEAKMLFEKVKQLDSSEEVQANADAYLNDIK